MVVYVLFVCVVVFVWFACDLLCGVVWYVYFSVTNVFVCLLLL